MHKKRGFGNASRYFGAGQAVEQPPGSGQYAPAGMRKKQPAGAHWYAMPLDGSTPEVRGAATTQSPRRFT